VTLVIYYDAGRNRGMCRQEAEEEGEVGARPLSSSDIPFAIFKTELFLRILT
jgi:hypothetical protein